MKLLLLGSGGREHALAWKICKSSQLEKLYVAPGNAGTSEIAENIAMDINDFQDVGNFCIQHQIDVVVVGPEQLWLTAFMIILKRQKNLIIFR